MVGITLEDLLDILVINQGLLDRVHGHAMMNEALEHLYELFNVMWLLIFKSLSDAVDTVIVKIMCNYLTFGGELLNL